MTDVSAGDTPATSAEPKRLVTIEELEARLDRLEQLQGLDRRVPAAACPHGEAPHDRTSPRPGASVVFSDEPCGECGTPPA